MKKCPRCSSYDDDSVRFCKNCNTELFFEYRFPKGSKGSEKRCSKIVQRATMPGEKHTNPSLVNKSLKFRVKFLMNKIMHAKKYGKKRMGS